MHDLVFCLLEQASQFPLSLIIKNKKETAKQMEEKIMHLLLRGLNLFVA